MFFHLVLVLLRVNLDVWFVFFVTLHSKPLNSYEMRMQKNFYGLYVLLFVAFLQTSAFASNMRDAFTDSIIAKTENYIVERVEEAVDDRYGFSSIFRVLWDVPFSSDEARKARWKAHFEEFGISKDSITRFVNEQIMGFNAMVPQKEKKITSEYIELWMMDPLTKVNVPDLNPIDEASFDLIIKRDRYELIALVVAFPLEIMVIAIVCGFIGAIIGIIDLRSEKIENLLVQCVCVLATFVVAFYLAIYFLVPIEVEITNSITENMFRQISNMNIFEQL